MSLCPRPQHPVPEIVLNEKFNKHRLRMFLSLGLCDYDYRGRLQSYLAAAGDESSVQIVYTDPESGIGRLEGSHVPTVKGKTTNERQMIMWADAKAAALHGVYHDVDVKCAHPTLLWQVLASEGLKYEQCKLYAEQSATILQLLMKATQLSKVDCKALLYKMLYGGRTETWLKEHELTEDVIPQQFVDMRDELQEATATLLDRYPMYREAAVNTKGADYWNIDGVSLSLLAQTMEKRVLLALYTHFDSTHSLEVGALIHDGLHLKTTESPGEAGTITPGMLRAASAAVHTQTGFKVTLVIKPFELPERLQRCFCVLPDDHAAAGDWLLEQIGTDLVMDDTRLFYRHLHVWHNNKHEVKRLLLNRIQSYDILDYRYRLLSKNMVEAQKLLLYVSNHATSHAGFAQEIWQSSLGKLCFQNGWFDFANGKLHPYGSPGTPHTLFMIPRDYTPSIQQATGMLNEAVFEPIFGTLERQTQFLQFLSRAMAGCVSDKVGMIGLGERNAGKGVLMSLCERAFGPYVKATNSENFMFKNSSGDTAKSLSWAMDYEFRRLCFSNEILMQPNKFLDGALLKKFCSGGDTQEARRNHCDEVQFKLQATLLILANDIPEIRPSDANQTLLPFAFPHAFVPEPSKPTHRKADPTIKEFCARPEIIDAFTEAVLRTYWSTSAVSMPTHVAATQESDQDKFFALVHPCPDMPDRTLTVSELADLVAASNLNGTVSAQKYNQWLSDRGCTRRKGALGRWEWHGLESMEQYERLELCNKRAKYY